MAMKAAVVESPGQLTVQNVPEPAAGEYGAFCELLYGASCSGTDVHLIDGHEPFATWIAHPFILGHESIGRVLRVGNRVRNLRVGDLVTRTGTPAVEGFNVGWGGFAEYGVAVDWRAMEEDGVPAKEWYGFRWNQVLPPDSDPAASTMFTTWRETLSYLQRMGVSQGSTLAVLGSGGNGLSYAAQARNLGAGTVTMIGSPRRQMHAERAGAVAFVDYHADDAAGKALAACEGGYDFVIDTVGTSAQADLGLSLLKRGGTIGIYGMDGPMGRRIEPDRARGTFTVYQDYLDEAETHEQVIALVRAGKLDASVWLNLDRPYELENIVEAFDAVRSRDVVKALVKLKP
jgi:threonine dehydrogenase-like Zn-dependent dehydrogenase